MNPEIIVNEATQEDVPEIRVVQKTTWLSTYPNETEGITKEDIEAKITEMQIGGVERMRNRIANDSEKSHLWVAKDGSRVVGFTGALKEEGKNNLTAIYVLPEYQGKGIGHQLIQKALDWLGFDKPIHLSVVAYNKNAIDFYKSHGFVEIGPFTQEKDYLKSGKLLPEIEMVLNPS